MQSSYLPSVASLHRLVASLRRWDFSHWSHAAQPLPSRRKELLASWLRPRFIVGCAPVAQSVVLITLLATTNAGCATLLKGTNSSMKIAGLPEDAVVETDDGHSVEREKSSERITISTHDQPRALRVTSGETATKVPVRRFVGGGWIVLGVVTGLIPLVVDAATGAWYEYEDTAMPRPPKTKEQRVKASD